MSIETDNTYWVDASHGWDDTAENLARFMESKPATQPNPDEKGWILLQGTLVPHPHNSYSTSAVSVSAPSTPGATLDTRHLAYLPQGYIDYLGHDTLPQLAELGAGDVEVTLAVRPATRRREAEIQVALVKALSLRDAARTFVTALETSEGTFTPTLGPDAAHQHTGKHPDLTRVLELISHFTSPAPEPVVTIRVVPYERLSTRRREYTVINSATGKLLGRVTPDVLVLADERTRDTTLAALAARGLPSPEPVTARWGATSASASETAPLNIRTYPRARAIDFRPHATSREDDITFAIYNPGSHKLWVEDSRLLDIALSHAARLGLDVHTYGLPKQAWNIENEVDFYDLNDPTRERHLGGRPNLLESVCHLVPTEVFHDEIDWADSYAGDHPESDDVVLAQELDAPARTMLLPWATPTSALAPCRLCGGPSVAVTAPALPAPVAYCAPCLGDSLRGLVTDRPRAAKALFTVAEHEFAGAPITEDQLESVVLPAGGVHDLAWLDTALLLRMGIARARLPWTLLLIESGLAPDGIRTGRGTVLNATDGHLCLSLAERRVCDFLHRHGIEHDREPLYPQHEVLNPNGRRRADWRLADGTLVEYWGLPTDPAYARKMHEKRELAVQKNLPLLELTEADLAHLPAHFEPWMQ